MRWAVNLQNATQAQKIANLLTFNIATGSLDPALKCGKSFPPHS
jgi:hypothetical protein